MIQFLQIIYDKRDDFDTVDFPLFDCDVSRLIRFARASFHINDFNTSNKFLTAKLLKQHCRYHKHRKAFSKFYRRHFELIEKYMCDIDFCGF